MRLNKPIWVNLISTFDDCHMLRICDIDGEQTYFEGCALFVMHRQPGALTGCGKCLLLPIRRNGLQHTVRLQFVSNGLSNQSVQPTNGCILCVLALRLHLPHYSHYSAACGLSNALPVAYGLPGD